MCVSPADSWWMLKTGTARGAWEPARKERIGVYRPRVEERRGDDQIERPGTVRESERMPSLDSRRLDVRRREVEPWRGPGCQADQNVRRADVNPDQRPPERNSRWFEVTPREQRDAPPVRSGTQVDGPSAERSSG